MHVPATTFVCSKSSRNERRTTILMDDVNNREYSVPVSLSRFTIDAIYSYRTLSVTLDSELSWRSCLSLSINISCLLCKPQFHYCVHNSATDMKFCVLLFETTSFYYCRPNRKPRGQPLISYTIMFIQCIRYPCLEAIFPTHNPL